jgi:hypothetical protein
MRNAAITEMSLELSYFASFYEAMRDASVQDPVAAYEHFAAAVVRRDVSAVLASLSDSYGRALRKSLSKKRFGALFELWCDTYPQYLGVAACYVDGDTATMEAQVQVDGVPLPGRVTLVHDGSNWRVDSESCADGRTRIPVSRLAPCKLT